MWCAYVFTLFSILNNWFVHGSEGFGDTTNFTKAEYVPWRPADSQRTDLFCPADCEENDECCSCEALTCWEIDSHACSVTISNLHIEYLNWFGGSEVIAEMSDATIYELIHTGGRMTSLPGNLCAWNFTTIVDLSHNRIQNIDRIRCLEGLYVLRMESNLINSIQNDTFKNFKYLRTVSFANNKLKHLDPFTFEISDGNLHTLNMSFNEFTSVDITNILWTKPFCITDYQGSLMGSITNVLNFTVAENELIGPGTTNFNKSRSVEFLNFSEIGVPYERLVKQLDGRFFYDESSMQCDCNLYPLFNAVGVKTYDIWPNMLDNDFRCVSPERMAGKRLKTILDSKNFGLLTCDLIENCPYKCRCSDRPSESLVTVNCSGAGLTELPHEMPLGHWNNYRLDLHLDGNDIQKIDDRNYINRVVNLNMNGNPVSSFPETVAERFEVLATVEIDSYMGSSIPLHFQKYDPEKVDFGEHPLICDCDNLWIGRWLRSYSAFNKLSCYANGQVVSAHIVDEYYFQCNDVNDNSPFFLLAGFLSVLASLLILTLLGLCFRYELLLLKRRYIQRQNYSTKDARFIDVFISLNDENEDVFNYVAHQVRERLLDSGYSVYIPWFDKTPGATNETEIPTAISFSCNYIVFVCEMYNNSHQCQSEFESIWLNYSADINCRLIIINFDALKPKDIHNRPLKACLRMGPVLDFKNREDRLLHRLIRKLRPGEVTNFDDKENNIEQDENDRPIKIDEEKLQPTPYMKRKKYVDDLKNNFPVDNRLDVDSGGKQSICNCNYRRCYLSDRWIPQDNDIVRKVKAEHTLQHTRTQKLKKNHHSAKPVLLDDEIQLTL